MKALAAIVGLIILLIGLLVAAAPGRFKRVLHGFLGSDQFYLAVPIRVIFGVIFMVAAPQTRLPWAATGIGIIFLLSAIAIPVMGPERVRQFAGYWLHRPGSFLRAWGAATAAFGCVCIWLTV